MGKDFVAIEAGENGEAYITHVVAEDLEDAYDTYQTVDSGNFVVITKEAFERMKGGKH